MRRVAVPLGSIAAVAAVLGTTLVMHGDKAQAKRSDMSVALTGVNVVDVRSGHILPHRTVIISGNSIIAIQDASAPLRPDTEVVPSFGKYLLPGLWDMHVHVTDERYLHSFVANGVTGVRDMGGGLDEPSDGCESVKPSILLGWRSEVAAGRRIGPELVISGPVVSGSGWPSSLAVRSPGEAKLAVRTLKRSKVDFIKVYERIPLRAYEMLASEAKRNGLPFAGHLPEDVAPIVAIRAGQRSIEHIRDALLVCFTSDLSELERFFAEDGWSDEDKRWGRAANGSCPALLREMREKEAWLTPTLTVEKAKVSVENAAYVQDMRRRFLPQSVRNGFSAYAKRKLAQAPSDRASERLWWRTQQKWVKRMSDERVKLLAGTDAACEGGLPGYSLHGELMEMVAAGLSPLNALRAATLEPARYFGRGDEGEVKAGHRANLLLLDANPLTNIGNTQRIHAVILNGKVLRRANLDELVRRPR